MSVDAISTWLWLQRRRNSSYRVKHACKLENLLFEKLASTIDDENCNIDDSLSNDDSTICKQIESIVLLLPHLLFIFSANSMKEEYHNVTHYIVQSLCNVLNIINVIDGVSQNYRNLQSAQQLHSIIVPVSVKFLCKLHVIEKQQQSQLNVQTFESSRHISLVLQFF